MFICFKFDRSDQYIDRCDEKGVENLSKKELQKVLKITRRLLQDLPQDQNTSILISKFSGPNQTLLQKCTHIFHKVLLNKKDQDLATEAIETSRKIILYKKMLSFFSQEHSDEKFEVDLQKFVLFHSVQSIQAVLESCKPIMEKLDKSGFTESYIDRNKKNFLSSIFSCSDDKQQKVIKLVEDLCETINTYEFLLEIVEPIPDLDDTQIEFMIEHGSKFFEDLQNLASISAYLGTVARIPSEHLQFFLDQVLPMCRSLSSAMDRYELLRIFIERAKVPDHFTKFITLINQQAKQFRDPQRRLEAIKTLNELEEVLWDYFEEESPIGTEIKNYRGESISLVLLQKLCRSLEQPSFFTVYKQMACSKGKYIIHKILPSIIPSMWMAKAHYDPLYSSTYDPIRLFITRKRVEFRDVNNPLMSNFLIACQAIDETWGFTPQDKLILLAKICSVDLEDQPIQKIINLLNKVMFICKMGEGKTLRNLPGDFHEEVSKIHNKLFSDVVLGGDRTVEDSLARYQSTFLSSRYPLCLEVFLSVIRNLQDIELNRVVSTFVFSVLQNTLQEERFNTENNIHLAFIQNKSPQVFEKWKMLPSEKSFFFSGNDNPGKIGLYSDWEDLFLCGTEVEGSCLRIDGSPEYNKALIAYCIDGKNALIAIKDPEGRLLCRAIFKILWDKENNIPVVFMETVYPMKISKQLKESLIKYAHEKAIECGCDLLVYLSVKEELKENIRFDLYKGKVVSFKGPCPYEYSDSTGGIASYGKFELDEVYKVIST
ncbi:MAG: hypothetical protein FJZ57_02290 [Chlamydiae bacterium]|nr:hypothetical protein [Chlamydiota bacterium]